MIRQLLIAELESAGLPLQELAKQANQIIIFGSRAAGVESPQSDLDVLCVGSGQRIISDHLDLLWVAPGDIESERWLGSELAGHVAAYGLWMKGSQDWKTHVASSPAAIQRKEQRLVERIVALNHNWNNLGPDYREHFLRLARRDLQRLDLLSKGRPVQPTPVLDRQWNDEAKPLETLVNLLDRYPFLGANQREMLTSHADHAWTMARRSASETADRIRLLS